MILYHLIAIDYESTIERKGLLYRSKNSFHKHRLLNIYYRLQGKNSIRITMVLKKRTKVFRVYFRWNIQHYSKFRFIKFQFTILKNILWLSHVSRLSFLLQHAWYLPSNTKADEFSISSLRRVWPRWANWKSWCHANLQKVQNQLSNLSHAHINFPSSIVRFVTEKRYTKHIYNVRLFFSWLLRFIFFQTLKDV